MPRTFLKRTRDFPYYITAEANNRQAFPCGPWFTWKTLTGELSVQQVLHGMQVHAFILMPNRFHLLATSPNRDVGHSMCEVMGSSTRIMNVRSGRTGHVYGGSYNWSIIGEPIFYAHIYKYVLRIPVEAALASFACEYPFSTYSGSLGEIHLPIRISQPKFEMDHLIPTEAEALDSWLNKPQPSDLREAIRRGIRWGDFQIFPNAKTRRKIDLSL